MRATLIDYTGAGSPDPWYAAALLIFTKNTRLEMGPEGLSSILAWSQDKMVEELEYMSRTIPSSWEFVHYTFSITEVTRALTHQLVRTRTASYAQQSQQIGDFSGFSYEVGPSILAKPEAEEIYRETMGMISEAYRALLALGVRSEDARGLLPTHIHTNICMSANLRTLSDLFKSRISPRNYGAMADLCRLMRVEMTRVHPWARIFFERGEQEAMEELDSSISALPVEEKERLRIHKLVDEIRRER